MSTPEIPRLVFTQFLEPVHLHIQIQKYAWLYQISVEQQNLHENLIEIPIGKFWTILDIYAKIQIRLKSIYWFSNIYH